MGVLDDDVPEVDPRILELYFGITPPPQELDEEVEFEEVLVAKHVSWCSSMHYPVLAAPFTSCRFVSERSISSKARKQRSSSSRWFGTRAMWTLLLARSVSSR